MSCISTPDKWHHTAAFPSRLMCTGAAPWNGAWKIGGRRTKPLPPFFAPPFFGAAPSVYLWTSLCYKQKYFKTELFWTEVGSAQKNCGIQNLFSTHLTWGWCCPFVRFSVLSLSGTDLPLFFLCCHDNRVLTRMFTAHILNFPKLSLVVRI